MSVQSVWVAVVRNKTELAVYIKIVAENTGTDQRTECEIVSWDCDWFGQGCEDPSE